MLEFIDFLLDDGAAPLGDFLFTLLYILSDVMLDEKKLKYLILNLLYSP